MNALFVILAGEREIPTGKLLPGHPWTPAFAGVSRAASFEAGR